MRPHRWVAHIELYCIMIMGGSALGDMEGTKRQHDYPLPEMLLGVCLRVG